MEIEAKRKARREAAEIEKRRREEEIAEHGDRPNVLFRRLIDEFRSELRSGRRNVPGASYPRAHDGSPDGSRAKAAGQGSLLVCVRKRPLLHHREGDEYDVLTAAGDRALICHEPRTKMDMSQTMEHHQFLFDHVFDEDASTADVYHEAVAPSLHATLESQLGGQRGNLTVFAYGQTGSGKTFTMEPIYAQTVAEALHACRQYEDVELSISFFEIYCAKVFDLLSGRAEVRTLEDARGEVQVENLAEEPVHEFDTAMDTIERGQNARVTHANAVHADSSRSHAVLQLLLRSRIQEEEIVGSASVAGYSTHEQSDFVGMLLGKLVLVDLAGSERASETLSDDKATRHEGGQSSPLSEHQSCS
jgi:kinesin family protein 2/24